MSDIQPKRRGRPPKAKPVEAVPESANVDRGEGGKNLSVLSGLALDADTGEHVMIPYDGLITVEREPTENMKAPFSVELSPAQIAALDHDHNGEAGGSLPKARLTENQLQAYMVDASKAYEGFGEQVREDQWHRIWRFGQETIKSHVHMSLSVKRGPMEYGRMIRMDQYRYSDIAAILRDLDEESSR